jgi:hypothetical protein
VSRYRTQASAPTFTTGRSHGGEIIAHVLNAGGIPAHSDSIDLTSASVGEYAKFQGCHME